ncbi:hypothetical protein [Halopelagius fulvigenes]|uniref:hypothetical protein n=1 Tax=Halopelagius fulvigenes TaxID=1198324 RepID=UPI0036D3CA34
MTWVESGRRRYCDRETCGERASLDGPAPDRCRSKDELLKHYTNALDALATFYHLADHGFDVDAEAGEEAIWTACDERRSGEGVEVISEALAAALTPP